MMKRVEKSNAKEIRKMKRIMKEAVKTKISRRNEFGLVVFLPRTIKFLGVFNT